MKTKEVIVVLTFDSEMKPKIRRRVITPTIKKQLKELSKKNHLNKLMNIF